MSLSAEEMQRIYREIHEQLIAPFPTGTVQGRDNDTDSKYIPVQPYIHRLETAAGTFWSWRLNGQPVIYEREDEVMVTGTLRIVDAEREGIGFANFQRYSDTGKIKSLKYTILSASSDALRNACDLYEMGWKDLSPYRKWAKNPGTGLMTTDLTIQGNSSEQSNGLKCVRCQKTLTTEDKNVLQELNITNHYCKDHIPQHLVKTKKKDR